MVVWVLFDCVWGVDVDLCVRVGIGLDDCDGCLSGICCCYE